MSKNEKDTQMNRRDFGKLIAAGSFVAVTGAIMPEAVFGQGGGHGEFRNMRRKERALSEDETWAVMKSCSYGFWVLRVKEVSRMLCLYHLWYMTKTSISTLRKQV
jgi:hypothetical protein